MPTLNKPARPGYKYAHPEETSGKSYMPHPQERVLESQASDIERIKKGLDTSETRPQNRAQVQNAAGRAILRSAGRAGAAGAALQGGYDLGREIDERTGAGKALVEKSGLGDAVERAVNRRDKVELSKESQERIAKGELEEKHKETAKRTRSEEPSIDVKGKYHPGRNPEIDDDTRESAGGYKRGGKVKITASSRADGIASRGKTRGRYL